MHELSEPDGVRHEKRGAETGRNDRKEADKAGIIQQKVGPDAFEITIV
jgi:hypothetical protein